MESQFYNRINLLKSRISVDPQLRQSHFKNSNPNSCLKPNDWKERVKNKTACTVFHKRGQSGTSKVTTSKVSNLQGFSVLELKDQLSNRQRYLQDLIEKIVVNQQQHAKQMEKIDKDYEQQIGELHQMLRTVIDKNRLLQQQLNGSRSRSPRMSNESLLLG